ncbi:MAG TPA: antibiotic biosynthesis monooxygenase [Terriglobia bacterium]|nr:antibiotic biosynthesis monooxygenase [Terriglobia bacterium]
MYARMVIGEAVSDEQTREFASIYAAEVLPELRQQPGFDSGRFMIEENGRMAVSLTLWRTRSDCLRYHSSRAYRNFVNRTQHLLVGNFVVKLFHDTGEPEDTDARPTDVATPE